jgi:protein O-mannosyl-transferase
MVVPNDLAIFYPHPHEQLAWSAVAVAVAVLLTITLAAVIWFRRFPYLFVGWCWYLGTFIPTIGIVQVGRQQMADRFTYFPSIGLFIAFVWLAAELAPAGFVRSRLLPAIGVACLAATAAICFVQVGYWQNSVTLFRHAIDCGQDSAVSRSFLGSALVASGHTSEGMAFLESAVAMEPNDHEFEFNLALALQTHGQPDAAAKHYAEALLLRERDAGVHLNLGVILLNRHDYQAAKRNFLRAAEIDPDEARAYANLSRSVKELQRFSSFR